MLKVAVLDDYQNAFQQIVDVDKHKDRFEFKVFNSSFNDEKEAIVENTKHYQDNWKKYSKSIF